MFTHTSFSQVKSKVDLTAKILHTNTPYSLYLDMWYIHIYTYVHLYMYIHIPLSLRSKERSTWLRIPGHVSRKMHPLGTIHMSGQTYKYMKRDVYIYISIDVIITPSCVSRKMHPSGTVHMWKDTYQYMKRDLYIYRCIRKTKTREQNDASLKYRSYVKRDISIWKEIYMNIWSEICVHWAEREVLERHIFYIHIYIYIYICI